MPGCSTAISPGLAEKMVTLEETARALEGVYRIAVFDRAGVAGFGRDGRSCARSFWAYAFALPATLLLIAIEVSGAGTDQPGLLAAGSLIADIIQAAGFPLLLLPLLRRFGRNERWPWFVTGYNWLMMAQTIASLTLVGVLRELPGSDFRSVVASAAQVYFLVLEAFLADAVLEIGAWRAGAIVLLDIAFQLAVSGFTDWGAGLS
jgi:hypothetical protein